MEKKKAYFVNTQPESVYELSFTKRRRLEKQHPYWQQYNVGDNPEELQEVYEFFKKNGKLLGDDKTLNLFVGLPFD